MGVMLHFEPTRKPDPADPLDRGALRAEGEHAIYEIESDNAGGWLVAATAHDGVWSRPAKTLDYAILVCRLADRDDAFGEDWRACGDPPDPTAQQPSDGDANDPIWVCAVCGSDRVLVADFVDANTGAPDSRGPAGDGLYTDMAFAAERGHTWCKGCTRHAVLVLKRGW